MLMFLLLSAAAVSDSVPMRATASDSFAITRAERAARSDSAGRDSTGRDSTGETLPLQARWLATIATGRPGPGQVIEPAGVATDAFGRIYVSDASLHRVQRYDERGRWLGESGALGSGPGQLRRPGALAALGTLSLAVLDRENRRILSYDLFGRLQGTLVDFEDEALRDAIGRAEPVAFGADRSGALYVADSERDQLLAFDASGRFLRTIGGYGARPGSFRGLAGVATGRKGEITVVERVNARVQRLDAGGRVLAAWPLPGSPARGALAVAVDDSGRVAVADEASAALWVFDLSGRTLARIPMPRGAVALAFARDGTLLVAETSAVRRVALETHTDVRGRREE